jgi:hypothetical protein
VAADYIPHLNIVSKQFVAVCAFNPETIVTQAGAALHVSVIRVCPAIVMSEAIGPTVFRALIMKTAEAGEIAAPADVP